MLDQPVVFWPFSSVSWWVGGASESPSDTGPGTPAPWPEKIINNLPAEKGCVRAAAVCVLPGCTPVEVAPPHTQTAAPRMLSPAEEEGRGGKGNEERRRGRRNDGRNINSNFKSTTHTPTCSKITSYYIIIASFYIIITSWLHAHAQTCNLLFLARKNPSQVLVEEEVCWPARRNPINIPTISSSVSGWPFLVGNGEGERKGKEGARKDW